MATFGAPLVNDLANCALQFYTRGPALLQTMQDRPLLAWLESNAKEFSGGNLYVNEPVKGTVMADTAGFMAGYADDQSLSFLQAQNVLQAQYPWKEVHAGWVITHTELKKDGISVTDGESNTSDHSGDGFTRLVGILENRLEDFAESWARANNNMLWADGSQDAAQVPGIRALLLDDPTVGTVGGLSQATYIWWQSRKKLDLAPSPGNQTMSIFFRNEAIQLQRYGGKPNKAFCGADFWDAISREVQQKGEYTTTGFTSGVDIGLNKISVKGIGTFEYDPTLDTLGLGKYCFVLDSRRTRLRPMSGERNKLSKPARPYNYMIMLQSMTNTEALAINQLNGQGAYKIA